MDTVMIDVSAQERPTRVSQAPRTTLPYGAFIRTSVPTPTEAPLPSETITEPVSLEARRRPEAAVTERPDVRANPPLSLALMLSVTTLMLGATLAMALQAAL